MHLKKNPNTNTTSRAPFQKIATRVNKPGLVLDSKDQDIPPELQCTMCKRLMKDAVLIPCCGYSFCDDCMVKLVVVVVAAADRQAYYPSP